MMSESLFRKRKTIARAFGACALALCAALLVFPLAGACVSAEGSAGGGEVAAASAVADGTLLGLDVRDYATNMAAKVPLAERQQIKHYKVVVFWNRVESSDGVFDWSYYDSHISKIIADGAESILLLLTGPVPAWARDPAYGQFATKAPPKNLDRWYRFCGEVANQYGHLVDFYEVWNEPGWDRDSAAQQTHGVFHFGGQVETEYLPLLQLANAAIKEKDPGARVICGALLYGMDPAPTAGTELYSLLFDDLNRPGQDVSIEVTSGKPIVAERPMYFNYKNTWTGGHDVLGATAAGREWYFAEGTTRGGFDEWLCLQNPNPTAIDVTATFMFGPGQGPNKTETYKLDPTSRTTFKVNDLVGPEKDVSIKITSASDFIAERPMYFSYGGGWTGGHDVVGAAAPSTKWYFAEGCTGYSIQEYLCLQNPHDESLVVDITFMMTKGEVFTRKVSLPARSRTTLDINRFIGFNGSSDMVSVHPYRVPADWGAHYAAVVQALRAKGAGHEAVCTEIGWPHYSDDHPEAYSEANQAADLGARGVGGLFNSGCRKIWIYRDLDEPPGTSWDKCYYGLFDYLGNPFAAWGSYKSWQSQLPDYPKLPGSI